jgi:hypothetical protein
MGDGLPDLIFERWPARLVAALTSIQLIANGPYHRSHYASSSRRALKATRWTWKLAFGRHEDRTPT